VKVLVTGASGKIGRVLTRGLHHDITEFDLPEHDARSLEQFAAAAGSKSSWCDLVGSTTTRPIATSASDWLGTRRG
jgi:hypothetical protein